MIDDILAQLGGCNYFTTINLKQGYLQIPLAEESKEKSAFISSEGLYEYNRLPFGLKTAPGLFQEQMNGVLKGYRNKFAMAYLDDVIIYSRTFEDHLKHLELVFSRFEQKDIQAKPSKCNFAKDKVPLLGHIVSKEGISVDPQKIEVISGLTPPTNVKRGEKIHRYVILLQKIHSTV